jgi:hypothetical protein
VNQRSLIFLGILTAAAVAMAFVLVTGSGNRAEIGTPLLARSVFGATAIEIAPPIASRDGSTTIRFQRDDDRWVVARDGWPANDAAVRGALRLLGEVAIAGVGANATEGETGIVIEFEGGERREFWIEPSSRAVGGGAAIRDERGAFGRAPVDLARAFESVAVDSWRSPAAMPRVEIEASRLTIEYADRATLALASVDGRWFVREPARAKADDRAVAALLGDLIDLRAVRFGGEPTASAGSGVVRVMVERDRRVPDASDQVQIETDRSVLSVLGPSNDDASETVVESDGVRLVVRSDRLGALAIDPNEFASRTAMRASASDVGMIVLRSASGEIAFRRDILSWDALGPAATRLLDPTVESGGVERTLAFLANAQADRVELGERDEPPPHFIQVIDIADDPLATIGVLLEDDGRVTLVDQNESSARRTYAAEQTPPLLRAWLAMD